MYLQTNGFNAKTHSIGHELYRIEKYTNRLKAIKDKELRPKINRFAAGAFVRNALFDPTDLATTSKSGESSEDWLDEKPAKRLKTT